MAVKKAEKVTGATEDEKTVNNTPKEEKAVSGANNGATEGEKKEEEVKLAYIGPSLPAGLLKTNKIMIGTRKEIKKELEAVLEKYPLVEKMLVPIEKLAEKKDRAKTAGNILHKYYSDIASAIVAHEREE